LRKALRRVFFACAAILVLFCLSVVGGGYFLRSRNPLAALDRGNPALEMPVTRWRSGDFGGESRRVASLSFHDVGIDTLRATLSLPDSVPPAGLGAIVILGGLEVGEKALAHVPAPGANAVLVYEYPYQPEYWYDGTPLGELPVVRRAVLSVPAQVDALARWVLAQDWSDGERVSILGYSFGALFVPAVYRLAGEHGTPLGPGVIAYGGADLDALLRANLKDVPGPLRAPLAWIAASLIHPVEPAEHLPQLRNEFLLVNGLHDRQIPEACWRLQQELLPEPKSVVELDEGHMHFKKPELTARLERMSRAWLRERGAFD